MVDLKPKMKKKEFWCLLVCLKCFLLDIFLLHFYALKSHNKGSGPKSRTVVIFRFVSKFSISISGFNCLVFPKKYFPKRASPKSVLLARFYYAKKKILVLFLNNQQYSYSEVLCVIINSYNFIVIT